MKFFIQILWCLLAWFFGAGVFYYISLNYEPLLIKHFYAVETATHVSPHWLRIMMDKWDQSFVLVDLRSEQEYLADHIRGAINIPAYKDPDTSAYDDKERILSWFQYLIEQYPDRDIIVYCYSTACMTGRKIGHFLAKNGVYVQHLGIGWNEWKYHRTLRNHEHERDITNSSNYLWTGQSQLPDTTVCPIHNEFGC